MTLVKLQILLIGDKCIFPGMLGPISQAIPCTSTKCASLIFWLLCLIAARSIWQGKIKHTKIIFSAKQTPDILLPERSRTKFFYSHKTQNAVIPKQGPSSCFSLPFSLKRHF